MRDRQGSSCWQTLFNHQLSAFLSGAKTAKGINGLGCGDVSRRTFGFWEAIRCCGEISNGWRWICVAGGSMGAMILTGIMIYRRSPWVTTKFFLCRASGRRVFKKLKSLQAFHGSSFLSMPIFERYRENLQRHPPLRTTDNHRLYDRDSIVTATASP